MSASYEIQLMLLATLLYLYDSSLLLHANEGVFVARSNGAWHATLGSEDFTILGKSVYLANPLTPHVATFRLRWSFELGPDESASVGWCDLPTHLAWAGTFAISTGIALFVLVPLGLFTRLGSSFAVVAGIAMYVSIIGSLVSVFVHRQSLQLNGRRFALLAFECITCPPFAVNLIRRIALGETVTEPLPDAAHRLLSPDRWAAMKSACARRLDYEISGEPDDSERAQMLREQRVRFHSSEREA